MCVLVNRLPCARPVVGAFVVKFVLLFDKRQVVGVYEPDFLVDPVVFCCSERPLALLVCSFDMYVEICWCQFLLPACFVVPYGCVCSVQFSFGVLVLEDFFCLFGLTKFDVHGSVHLGNIRLMNIYFKDVGNHEHQTQRTSLFT
jgi:hypothetical protein